MRTDTEEQEGEELSEREQDPHSDAEDEPDPTDLEATPTQDPKGKKPEVVIQHPTPMKPIVIPETREDREDREERAAHALIDSMFSIYHFHKPDGHRFEPTPRGLSALICKESSLPLLPHAPPAPPRGKLTI